MLASASAKVHPGRDYTGISAGKAYRISSALSYNATRRIVDNCCKAASGWNGPVGPADQGPCMSRRGLLQAVPLSLVVTLSSNMLPAACQAAGSFPRLPTAEEKAAIDAALTAALPKTKAAGAVRLVFHDAGTYSQSAGNGGANASIRFELERPENFGLKRSWRVVEQVQQALKGSPAESTVSAADIIVLAGAYAVALCGGPQIKVRIGRTDAKGPDPEGRLPEQTLSASQQVAVFADKGFSVTQFVALSGAHTIGGKGFGDSMTFDNAYYQKPWLNTKDAMASMIGLPSDHVLPEDPVLLPIIKSYADNQNQFFQDFSAAYLKMSESGALWRA